MPKNTRGSSRAGASPNGSAPTDPEQELPLDLPQPLSLVEAVERKNGVINFGRFRREYRETQQANPIIIDLAEDSGDPQDRYALSPILPSGFAIEYQRLMRMYKDETKIPHAEIFSLAQTLFPPDVLDALMGKHQFDVYELAMVMAQVMLQYKDQLDAIEEPAGAEGNGERRRGRRRPSTSSSTGPTSKPTSGANIA
jgi:hypothetical protein